MALSKRRYDGRECKALSVDRYIQKYSSLYALIRTALYLVVQLLNISYLRTHLLSPQNRRIYLV